VVMINQRRVDAAIKCINEITGERTFNEGCDAFFCKSVCFA